LLRSVVTYTEVEAFKEIQEILACFPVSNHRLSGFVVTPISGQSVNVSECWSHGSPHVITKHEARINILDVRIVSLELANNFKAILILAMNCMQLDFFLHGYRVTTHKLNMREKLDLTKNSIRHNVSQIKVKEKRKNPLVKGFSMVGLAQ
jgi:hypothetical protein